MTTGAFSRNVGKLFSELKFLHEANPRTQWNNIHFLLHLLFLMSAARFLLSEKVIWYQL